MSRPLMNKSNADLSRMANELSDNAAELDLISFELKRRDSKSARALRGEVEARLAALKIGSTPDEVQTTPEIKSDSVQCSVSIAADVAEKIGFVSHQNSVPPLRSIALTNDQDVTLENLRLSLRSEPDFLEKREWKIDRIGPNDTLHINDRRVEINGSYTRGLSESERGQLILELTDEDGEQVAQEKFPVELLAYDEWGGATAMPELLAAFSMPNDPSIDRLLKSASEILRRAGKDGSIDGYKSGDRRRIYELASAIWTAVCDLELSYAVPPASFEEQGQKVRTPGSVMRGRLATCLDTALLFTSALEQAGLHPLIVLTKGHAFAGLWLQPTEFADLVTDSAGSVRNRIELDEVIVFETTLVADNPPACFSDAVAEARRQIEAITSPDFFTLIDIHRGRMQKLRPLSVFSEKPDDSESVSKRSHALDLAPRSLPKSFDLADGGAEEADAATDKIIEWQRKLLDLTARNRLLNLPKQGSVLELVCPDPGRLEDLLADGKDIKIRPVPDLEIGGRDVELHRQRSKEDLLIEHARQGLERGEIYSELDKKKLDAALIKLYRAAKSDLEEGGANTLYLAMGFLEWKKDPSEQKTYRAPLILLPVSLKRRSARADMKLCAHSDDARFNMTLVELLKEDFALELPGLDRELPSDDSGIDVHGVWNHVRQKIKDSSGFEVRNDIVLGIFSFSKYLMWKDLRDRAEQLKQNRVVRHLIEGGSQSFASTLSPDREPMVEAKVLDKAVRPENLFAPLPADSSQLAAVVASGQGYDFVLDGPPGTGKSQTIANMIAHNLALGKRVLFVSEKRAALDVVYRRLEAIGLGEFCLELHSHKSAKSEVIRQLDEAWNARGALSPEEWSNETQRLEQLRDQLNVVAGALHKQYSNGMTVHDAVWRSIRDDDELVPALEWPASTEHSQHEVEAFKQSVRMLELTFQDLRAVDPLVIENVELTEWSNVAQASLVAVAKELTKANRELSKIVPQFCKASGLPFAIECFAEAADAKEVISDIGSMAGADLKFAFEPNSREIIEAINAYATGLQDYRDLRAELSTEYGLEAEGDIDTAAFSRSWGEAGERFWFFEDLAKRKIIRELGAAGKTSARPDPGKDLPILERLRTKRAGLEVFGAKLAKASISVGLNSDPSELFRMADLARIAKKTIQRSASNADDLSRWNTQLRKLIVDANDLLHEGSHLSHIIGDFREAIQNWSASEQRFLEIGGTSLADRSFSDVDSILEAIGSNSRALQSICHWNKAKREAESSGLGQLVELIEGGLPEGVAVPLFETAYAKWFATWAIDGEPLLRQFNARIHEDAIDRFRAQTDAVQDLTSKIVRARLCSNLPEPGDVARKSGFGILKHEIAKKRRHKAVRQLAEEMGEDFTKLAPCMLMSPLSIAQYLPADQALFDIVIFDEASQITPWDAVGSIARGRQLVLAGDDKQMPPTNFFTKGTAVAIDDDLGDLDSILEECQGAGIPPRSLNWHYRSRHDSLIAFSNSRYYGNNLVTFPAPETRASAVSWRRVDGIYAKGRGQTNAIEAKAIVEEVKSQLSGVKPGAKTLGVVTLNSQQQELILDLLETERSRNAALDAHFSDDLEEPIFVKNLETVQGDERDIIILGVTFGPIEPEAQSMSMNFGPLNRDGGERRLNVAITRARQEMILFTSFDASMIDLSRTSATAIRDLKHFIEYADKGPRALAEAHQGSVGATESPFEDAVKAMLEKRGWITRPQIGVSSYRIDLGVVHPDRPGDFLAGIECDGAMYHSALTARDRDKVRQAVLEGLGWRILRIWSTDFWIDADKAIERVHERLMDLLELGREGEIAASELNGRQYSDATDSALVETENADDPEERSDEPVTTASREESAGENVETTLNDDALFARRESEFQSSPSEAVRTEYRRADLVSFTDQLEPDRFHDVLYTPVLKGMISAIVEVEAPIQLSSLSTRIARAHGFMRTGGQIMARIRKIAKSVAHLTTEASGAEVIWARESDEGQLSTWRIPTDDDEKRPIEEIPDAELRVAGRYYGDEDDPAKAIAEAYGFSRLRAPSRRRIEGALRI
ncbi:DUF3320 domain-containing protein [Sphingomicrobium arenosum]|uniref:DUF3320 domain-containing protein n=1 Tax=Sphingomicrobium arenosum TaxID=2233861 RepID=UPI00223FAD78|nr:DUF3320 domain-containing protein [Sphingomicrobium arenosum]